MPKVGKKERPKLNISNGEGYCRKCKKVKSLSQFYEATNPMLDSNNYMSICRECCNNLYDYYFSIYNNVEKALEFTCQDLDVRFNQVALSQTQSQIDNLLSKGKTAEKVFGYYKSKLSSTGKYNAGIEGLRYKDSENNREVNYIQNSIDRFDSSSDENKIDDDLILFWGHGFDYEDYVFLENEITNWKQTHKCDNQAEVTLLKEICIKVLAIRKKRARNDSVSSDLKELQELMKTASVDPAKSNVASAGKSHESFGVWIKDIEQLRPAEWFEKQSKYKDMDGFTKYIENYIVRPIRNFLTGSRDFLVDDNINSNLDAFDDGEK